MRFKKLALNQLIGTSDSFSRIYSKFQKFLALHNFFVCFLFVQFSLQFFSRLEILSWNNSVLGVSLYKFLNPLEAYKYTFLY